MSLLNNINIIITSQGGNVVNG